MHRFLESTDGLTPQFLPRYRRIQPGRKMGHAFPILHARSVETLQVAESMWAGAADAAQNET